MFTDPETYFQKDVRLVVQAPIEPNQDLIILNCENAHWRAKKRVLNTVTLTFTWGEEDLHVPEWAPHRKPVVKRCNVNWKYFGKLLKKDGTPGKDGSIISSFDDNELYPWLRELIMKHRPDQAEVFAPTGRYGRMELVQ